MLYTPQFGFCTPSQSRDSHRTSDTIQICHHDHKPFDTNALRLIADFVKKNTILTRGSLTIDFRVATLLQR